MKQKGATSPSKRRLASAPQSSRTGQRSKPVARWKKVAGRRLLVLQNAWYRVVLWPEMGGAIAEYVDLATGLDVIWRNPRVQPPRARMLDQPVGGGSDLFDVMDGSWYVSLPAGFFAGDYFGAPLGTHGELRALPWAVTEIVEDATTASVTLVGQSVRTPLVYRRTLTVHRDDSLLHWEESVENVSFQPLPVAWLQHPTFGGPLIVGAQVITPAKSVRVFQADDPTKLQLQAGYAGRWPFVPERIGGKIRDCSVVPPPGSGTDHSVQLTDFAEGWGCIWNDARRLGFAMEWELAKFPYAWSWNLSGGAPGYPLWGEGHLVTLQPSTSPVGRFADLLRNGETMQIPAHGAVTTKLVTGFVHSSRGPWSQPKDRP